MKLAIPLSMFVKSAVLLIFMLPTLRAMASSETVAYQNECMGCHDGQNKARLVVGPPLGGLGEQYILRQLEGFKYGRRGSDHSAAQIMSQAIGRYSDQELKEIARWASKIKSSQHFDSALGEGSDGYQLYQEKCSGCHDSRVGRFMTGSPKLRNLEVDYIIRQLHLIDDGFRNFDQPTKHQLKMQTVIKSLTDDEFEVLTRFIARASLDKNEDIDE